MKKKLIALMLALVMLLGLLPAASPKAEAFDIAGLMGIGGNFYNGIKKTVSDIQNRKTGNDFLSAFAATFKNIGCEIAGIDTSSGSSSENYEPTVIVNNQVDLSGIESSLADITTELKKQSATLTAIKSQIDDAAQKLSKSIDDNTQKVLDALNAIGNATQAVYYDNYLTEFFSCYSDFRTAVTFYENSLVTDLNAGCTDKLDYDYFYLLSGYYGSNYLPAGISKLGSFLNGTYTSQLGNVSVVRVLYDYYTLAGYTQEQAAATVNEYLKLLYYTYSISCYDYTMLSVYMLGWCKENNKTRYTMGDNTFSRSTGQLENELKDVLDGFLSTSETLFGDICTSFAKTTDISVFAVTPAGYATTYKSEDLTLRAAKGATLYLPSAADIFAETIGSDIEELFGELAEFSYSVTHVQAGTLDGRVLKTTSDSVQVFDVMVNETLRNTSLTKTVASYRVILEDNYLGKGTENDPIIISSVDEWNSIAGSKSGNTFTGVVYLAADIDFGGKTITPFYRHFSGTFYGNGHTMKNGKITSSPESVCTGLFPYAFSADFYDLKLENITVDIKFSTPWPFSAGVLVGRLYTPDYRVKGSSITRCSVNNCSVSLNATDDKCRELNLGGIAGTIQTATITNCLVSNTQLQGRLPYVPNQNGEFGTVNEGGIAGKMEKEDNANGASINKCGVVNCKLPANFYYLRTPSGGGITPSDQNRYCVSNSYVGGILGSIEGTSQQNYINSCWVYMQSGAEIATPEQRLLFLPLGESSVFCGKFVGRATLDNNVDIIHDACSYYSGSDALAGFTTLENVGYSERGKASAVSGKTTAATLLPVPAYDTEIGYFSDGFSLKHYSIMELGAYTDSLKLAYRLNESYEPENFRVHLTCGGRVALYNIKGYSFYTNFNSKQAGKYETRLTCGGTVTMRPVVYTIVNVLGGDVNGDSAVDLKDVSALFQWWNGKQTLAEDMITAGDYNGDNATDLRDAAAIFRANA